MEDIGGMVIYLLRLYKQGDYLLHLSLVLGGIVLGHVIVRHRVNLFLDRRKPETCTYIQAKCTAE
ncbi:uncharacterized protein EI97DRAFT_311641 [Westerdykella ornata]|uniref:Uncharacterized protein n=1 Tax=Westerdykella ornata TaxID=318751 RepID=A0A6A6JLP0_WESOR|nr:uncharacterized protein EI97DRAFT_311641 [Westerdykella ornata]KAF2277164.1 hypothetical protein EI97DRAFT_311641 [Westerdykella ornata]